MKGLLDDQRIDIPCPKCGHKLSETLAKLKTNPDLTCPACGEVIAIDASKLSATLDDVDKQFTDLERFLGNLGKKR